MSRMPCDLCCSPHPAAQGPGPTQTRERAPGVDVVPAGRICVGASLCSTETRVQHPQRLRVQGTQEWWRQSRARGRSSGLWRSAWLDLDPGPRRDRCTPRGNFAKIWEQRGGGGGDSWPTVPAFCFGLGHLRLPGNQPVPMFHQDTGEGAVLW